ncbi:DNA polymerase II [Oleiphilus messinensis]|uniref:DNA polymerase II n=1 Tax=Oleiphilus messinensis TaxID=141451 RepID=UPI0018E0003E|nr:DNA polymerase II [Oleiphilus messinensis]
MSSRGFLLTRQWQDQEHPERAVELTFWLLTPNGPECVRIGAQFPVFFVPLSQQPAVEDILTRLMGTPGFPHSNWWIKPLELVDFLFQPVAGVYFRSQYSLYRARDALSKAGQVPLEADIQPTDRYLMERFISSSVSLCGNPVRNGEVTLWDNPQLKPEHYVPKFRVLSLDIETSMDATALYSIAWVVTDVYPEQSGARPRDIDKTVVVLHPENVGQCSGSPIMWVDSELSLLEHFIRALNDLDPDILIGWNVINFDLRVLQRKADTLGYPLLMGRGGAKIDWRQSRDDAEHYTLTIPGRLVLDGIDTLKSATYNFESFSLQFVANAVLQRGKLIDHVDDRGEEITRLFREEPEALAAYNLEDCQLVQDIFAQLQLIAFAVERAHRTGLVMDRFGGSVAAFDHHYLPRLHRKGFVAPAVPQNPEGVGSPGGYVMDSRPGLYRNVLVLDFKSLYPSIIRTFKIDPLARIQGAKRARNQAERLGLPLPPDRVRDPEETAIWERDTAVPGFNGAVFDQESALLPDIIGELWRARDKAKQSANSAMSQAIKILMNSFYGVLGTPGCRFFDYRLPSSITLRGHQVLSQTRVWIETLGHDVIYGDTDSVFVWLKPGASPEVEADNHGELKPEQVFAEGERLAGYLNSAWAEYLSDRYGVRSYLEIEFETYFQQFVMPTIRGSDTGSKKRYAGLQYEPDGRSEMVFKGLETVRTDWTPLARQFQKELYRRIFAGEPYEGYIRDLVVAVRAGEKDAELYFRKRIRRPLQEYQKNIPPHVQAARKADQIRAEKGLPLRYRRGGWIQYVLTISGPEPLEFQKSILDYDLYIERQLIPIADGILHFMQSSFQQIAGDQLDLF